MCINPHPHYPLSGLGTAGGALCETRRLWREGKVHPQGRSTVLASVWLVLRHGKWAGEKVTLTVVTFAVRVMYGTDNQVCSYTAAV